MEFIDPHSVVIFGVLFVHVVGVIVVAVSTVVLVTATLVVVLAVRSYRSMGWAPHPGKQRRSSRISAAQRL
ncbi:hypothetical protein NtRootA4_41270 (plasmid) [Arthrobacter sp. NtRootA4]|uniref:Uncharacterized protein n=1 Tax=Paenarthrobacter nicotinovorans TaxID=29320 RepID=Q8GAM5_PAENI|nr:hypothetical protein [Paenarthrobacter nicotinovorans]BCW12968.1 hypothetical protein NtRootA2_42500 [Arthrobacter sp. NtRootA2]BCW17148.1 hypothetical protein NtRootA4_41270 [Arthrobacter sp. NtRootA4]BCW25256.1 hypothetical protein NtRootC7_41230 [Arthrobacter sp. NtRootC7]BCW29617.1 hypothetical protein NtRootC45_42170 [Arthrobacter sp. NtRootC45]BCW33846.1 hypothetical protein NtRootD5_41770 [Arthrobacter sp. NtRootD5]